jgi:hypothetical protein
LKHHLLVRRWSEPVDLPFLLSQTKYNWSLAEVDADMRDSGMNKLTGSNCFLVYQ